MTMRKQLYIHDLIFFPQLDCLCTFGSFDHLAREHGVYFNRSASLATASAAVATEA